MILTFIPRYRWNPLARASNETGMGKNGKNADFRPINHYISATVEDKHIVTMEDLYEIAYGISIVTNIDDLENHRKALIFKYCFIPEMTV